MFVATRKYRVWPGRKQEFVDTWHTAIGSRLKKQPGFITAFLLTSSHDDEVMVMSQWDDASAHNQWRTSEMYRQVHAHIGGLMLQRMGDKNYEIAAQVETPGDNPRTP